MSTTKRKGGQQATGDEHAKKTKMALSADWKTHDSVMYKAPGSPQKRTKVAGFGVDNCLVFTKSASVSAASPDDWRLYNADVPKTLQKLYEDGYKIVIYTNATAIKGAFEGKQAARVCGRIENLLERLQVPVCVYVATKEDQYCKPGTGMWELCLKHSDVKNFDKKNSFYVGSAAGRKPEYGVADKKFCEAVQIPYYTPEDLFGDMDFKGEDDIAHGGKGGGKNPKLVNSFRTLANLFKDDEPRKRLVYRRVANALEEFPEEVKSAKQVSKLEGVTRGVQALIEEWLELDTMTPIEEIQHPDNYGLRKREVAANGEDDAELASGEEDGDLEDEYVELV